ncbi:MAG: hypothetical protein HQ517_00615 [SAR324 cluster bacterium]|nr:hypothetical protein [SAR324 cluster bacterium]
MKIINKVLVIFIGLLFPVLAPAQQNTGDTGSMSKQPGLVYVSSEGKLYVKSKTPIYLRLATSPEKNGESFILRNQSSKDPSQSPQPFNFEGDGVHSIRHMTDHRVPQKNSDNHLFHVYDDGKAPRSKITVSEAPWVFNGNVNIYGKPVKISLAFSDGDSGVFAGYVALNSEAFTKYEMPLTLDQEIDYKLQYYAIDNVSNQSKSRARLYSLDFTPPETVVQIMGGHLAQEGEDILSPKSKITLKSRDLKAGVKQIHYRFKGKKEVYTNKVLTMSGLKDGSHNLVFAAEDRVQNLEENKTFNFYLDSIPPVVRDELGGDQYLKGTVQYVSGRTTVTLTATDNKAGVRGIRHALNGKKNSIYSNAFYFPQKNGKVAYSFRANDKVLNLSSVTTKNVTVDISEPKIKPDFKGEHYFTRETHYIRLTTVVELPATDNLSGIKEISYNVDSSADIFNAGPIMVTTEGSHMLAYRASDNVNNQTGEKTITLYADEIAPEIFTHFGTNPTVTGQQIYPLKSTLYLAATDKQAGIREIYYSINGSKEFKYRKPLTFNKKQSYGVKIRAIDNVGNVSTSDANFEIQ